MWFLCVCLFFFFFSSVTQSVSLVLTNDYAHFFFSSFQCCLYMPFIHNGFYSFNSIALWKWLFILRKKYSIALASEYEWMSERMIWLCSLTSLCISLRVTNIFAGQWIDDQWTIFAYGTTRYYRYDYRLLSLFYNIFFYFHWLNINTARVIDFFKNNSFNIFAMICFFLSFLSLINSMQLKQLN